MSKMSNRCHFSQENIKFNKIYDQSRMQKQFKQFKTRFMRSKIYNREKLSILGVGGSRDVHGCKEVEALCKIGLGIKHLQKLSCFILIFLADMMTELALLVKTVL